MKTPLNQMIWSGVVALALVACGGGGSSEPSAPATNTGTPSTAAPTPTGQTPVSQNTTPPTGTTSPTGTSPSTGGTPSTATTPQANIVPVAFAGGAQNAALGLVTVNGGGSSDANGDPITYAWTLTSKPSGSTAVLTTTTAVTTSFTADMAGSYVVSLTVHDGKVSSSAASVTITVAASAWQAQSSAKVFTALAPTTDDTVNPMRGYYRWRGQEKVTQVSPALDAYQRYRWKDLETGLGTYNFATVLSDLQTAKSQGRKFALRVQAMLGYDDGQVYIPSYLVNHASCQNGCGWWADYDAATPGLTFVPDWNDPYVQQRASALLQALSTAMGSQDDFAWIDIGMFGQWGEWALSSGINYATAPAGIVAATDATKREFVDMHLRAFPTRQMVMLAIYSRYNEVRYATTQQTIASKPVGMRIDCLGRGGFMDQWTNHPTEWATLQNVWKTAPFVAEYCQFPSGDLADTPLVAQQQVRDFHISTVGNGNIGDGSVNSWASFTPTEQQQFIQVGRDAGYRYRVDTANMSLTGNGLLSLSAVVRNDGNAPTYEPWNVLLELISSGGNTVWSQTLVGDLKTNLGSGSSQSFSTSVQLPVLSAGDYTLKLIARDARRLSATPVRAPLRWTVAERTSDGGVDLASLRKN
jgi:hypothetical protein